MRRNAAVSAVFSIENCHEKNPDDVRPMAIMFAGILGCRLGEIVGLRWKCAEVMTSQRTLYLS